MKSVVFNVGLTALVISQFASAGSNLPQDTKAITLETQAGPKVIRLMDVDLSKKQKNDLVFKSTQYMNGFVAKTAPDYQGMHEIQLGMNNVPVLDQGMWGTCATFATTAAINAYQGLYDDAAISQLCNLQLGRTIHFGGNGGWNGSYGELIFQQINEFGYMTQADQKASGCGGLTEYPMDDEAGNGDRMLVRDFYAHSDKSFTENDWQLIQSAMTDDPAVADKVLAEVKNSLARGHRTTFGVLLDVKRGFGTVGAIGTYNNVDNSTWVITPEIINDIVLKELVGGHEMVITGFDDNACASYTDSNGHVQAQCGLLTLRNSWGEDIADKGNFYMTYDYFKSLTLEVAAVGPQAKHVAKTIS